ncbi:MAG: DUF6152 family protein, partial [Gammaproteobacteria bacterium]|nr:DUF6152 family protein [Gammaproteobacteria bacterium]
MNRISVFAAIGVAVLISPAAVEAHHAFAAQYDVDKPASMTGVVVKIEWLNPHAYFFIDVTDET